MKKVSFKPFLSVTFVLKTLLIVVLSFYSITAKSQVTMESEIEITDRAMYFNGNRVPITTTENSTTGYDFAYGRTLTPHGDCIKTYKQYVFMSWYRGGKEDRHVMLTRYNTETNTMKTIEFPHQHTGYKGRWWIGETHNTIAVGVSPINGTVHLVYDMHAYTNSGVFENDYFRYSYSVENAADLPDADFTIDKFVKDPLDDDYRHTTMDGVRNARKYDRFTYPQFFLNDDGELFLTARDGTSHDGAQAFIKYDAATEKWGDFYYFNALKAQSKGETHDWSIYGSMKYTDGKIRIGYQRRLNTGTDKYNAQNGVYYAYSDDPTGATQWKNHEGEDITFPIVKAEETLVFEPGDLVETQARKQVHIVSGFDWTVTDNGDVHIISRVQDRENNVTKNIHSYKPNGASEFIISTDFAKASNIYTSGNDIFVIGLNASGRPFVDRALGGTNSFARVYEQTLGRCFSKGQVHIADGKLYYYLLETKLNNDDDVRSTYLQIIDLDISTEPEPFNVSLLAPQDGASFREGSTVELFAKATTDSGSISKVAFMVNGELYEEDVTKPYMTDWIPSAVGSYTIQAIAYDDSDQSISSSTHTVEVLEIDKTDLTGTIYRLKNLATGKYLTSNGRTLTMSDDNTGKEKEWEFVKSKTGAEGNYYYNIDSQTSKGILRFVANSAEGEMINTDLAAPRPDGDKIWNVIYNEDSGSYSFEARDLKRYLYHSPEDLVTHAVETDDRSKWIAESDSSPLSVDSATFVSPSIRVYPNPTNGEFTIALQNLATATIAVYALDGKLVYKTETTQQNTTVKQGSLFTSGMYIIQVKSDGEKIHHQKLIIK